jgi:hypothetical protein
MIVAALALIPALVLAASGATITDAPVAITSGTATALQVNFSAQWDESGSQLEFYARLKNPTPAAWNLIAGPTELTGSSGSWSASANLDTSGVSPGDGEVIELLAVVRGSATPTPSASVAAQWEVVVDDTEPQGYLAAPLLDDNDLPYARQFVAYGVAKDPQPEGGPAISGMAAISFQASGSFSGMANIEPDELGPATMKAAKVYDLPAYVTGLALEGSLKDVVDNKTDAECLIGTESAEGCDPADISGVNGAPAFDDVAAGSWYEPYVRYMAAAKYFSGYGGNKFGPNDPLLRGQLAKLLVIAAGYSEDDLPDEPGSAACVFVDVDPDAWYAGWVWQACELGLMKGYGNYRFGPNDPVTRGQIAQALYNLYQSGNAPDGSVLGVPGADGAGAIHDWGWVPEDDDDEFDPDALILLGPEPFTDVAATDYYYEAVSQLYNVGIISGTSATTYEPARNVTRAEAATLLYRALGTYYGINVPD